MQLPDRDQLFEEYFAPWYSPVDRVRKMHGAIRPDMEELGAAGSLDAAAPSPLTEKVRSEVAERINAMADAAGQDWQKLLKISGKPSMAWLTSFDAYFGPKEVLGVVMNSSTEAFSNDYLVLCCELGSVIGTVMRGLEPRLTWLYDSPYWESALYDAKTGSRLNVFHWAIKRLSEHGAEDGVADKVRRYCEMLRTS